MEAPCEYRKQARIGLATVTCIAFCAGAALGVILQNSKDLEVFEGKLDEANRQGQCLNI